MRLGFTPFQDSKLLDTLTTVWTYAVCIVETRETPPGIKSGGPVGSLRPVDGWSSRAWRSSDNLTRKWSKPPPSTKRAYPPDGGYHSGILMRGPASQRLGPPDLDRTCQGVNRPGIPLTPPVNTPRLQRVPHGGRPAIGRPRVEPSQLPECRSRMAQPLVGSRRPPRSSPLGPKAFVP